MTEQQHPIVPPLDLIKTWMIEYYGGEIPGGFAGDEVYLCKCAAQWGADHELEACCELMDDWGLDESDLRTARRPKPPSLKEQALLAIDTAVADDRLSADVANVVRRALEALPE